VRRSVTDVVIDLVIGPALVMGLVGSLVFFLLEVFYAGDYQGRMRWILFFFVFGAVLIARVSMLGDGGSVRAGLYGLVLGFLTLVGLQMFVEYPPGSALASLSGVINLGLVALVLWCSHRLTWDCTHQGEDTDATGRGVLQAAQPGEEPPQQKEEPEKRESWLDRFQRYRAERKRKRTPGVWVVYFSLAALPLFGLGQALIPAGDGTRRRYTFWLLAVYVACGLGLLLTTCFLGLRRYLRRRNLTMPPTMAGVWLSVGAALIVFFLVAAALLPRPSSEYSLLDLGGAASKERSSSRWAQKGGEAGKGEGRGEGRGEGHKGQGGQGSEGKGEGEGGKGKGKDKGGEGKGKDGGGKGEKGKDKGQGDRRGKSGGGQRGKGERGGERQSGRTGSTNGQQKGRTQGDRAGGEGEKREGGKDGKRSGSGGSSPPRPSASRLANVISKIAPILKWVVFGVLALVVLFFVLRMGLQFLANFTKWARDLLQALRDLWARLFGGWGGKGEREEAEEEEWERESSLPFSAFANPFATGEAERMPVRQLIRYTFAAAQAWARERDLGRAPGETAQEFAERVGEELPAVEEDLRRLALLFGRAAYARGGLPARSREVVRQVWAKLEVAAEQPLSA
jgi:hypothetical protein